MEDKDPKDVDELISEVEAHSADESLPGSVSGFGDTDTCNTCTCPCEE
jgi:hypothetical protein